MMQAEKEKNLVGTGIRVISNISYDIAYLFNRRVHVYCRDSILHRRNIDGKHFLRACKYLMQKSNNSLVSLPLYPSRSFARRDCDSYEMFAAINLSLLFSFLFLSTFRSSYDYFELALSPEEKSALG